MRSALRPFVANNKAYLYMLLAGLLFSFMNVMVKMTHGLPTLEVVFFRSVISLVISLGLILRRGRSPWGKNRLLLLARGLAGCGGLICYFFLMQRIPLASAVTFSFLVPIVSSLIAVWLFAERVTWVKWVFLAISLAGVVWVEGFDPRISPLYMAVGLAAALFSAIAYAIIRKLRETEYANVIIFYFPLVTLPITGAYSLFHWQTPQGMQWVWLLSIGLLTQAAQYALTRSYQLAEVSKVAPLNYLTLIHALLLGWIFFGEVFDWPIYLGMGVVFFGVVGAMTLGRPKVSS